MENKPGKEDENLGSFYMGRTRAAPQPKRLLPPGLLTAIALFVFAGILWYAYPRGAEKYSNIDVPIVKADTAPVKEEPVDPGGMEVMHQDSTVFDTLQKNTAASVENLMPAQEEPIDKEAAIQSPPTPTLPAANEVKPAVAQPPAEPAPAVVAEEKKKAPAASSASGDFYIQLGSFRDVAGVTKDWERLTKKFPEQFEGLLMKTEKVELAGKGTYYRLQAGKTTSARAKEVCKQLKEAKAAGGCIVVRGK